MIRNNKIIFSTGALLISVIVVLIGSIGWTEEVDRMLIRITAKTSLILFLLAFSASALYALWPGKNTLVLLKARRQIGLSFALSHTFHLSFVLLLQFYFQAQNFEERGILIVSGGAIAYIFLYAMTLTSTDNMVKRLGIKKWKRLHTIGSYYIFMVFSVSYLPRAVFDFSYIPYALLLITVLGLRIWKNTKR